LGKRIVDWNWGRKELEKATPSVEISRLLDFEKLHQKVPIFNLSQVYKFSDDVRILARKIQKANEKLYNAAVDLKATTIALNSYKNFKTWGVEQSY
jgi:hypothetical protein